MPTPARSVLMALMSAPANPSATSPRTPKPGTWKTRAASTPAAYVARPPGMLVGLL
jgi:hypothetical protein